MQIRFTLKNYIYNIDLLFFFYRFALRKLLKHRLKTQFVWKSVDCLVCTLCELNGFTTVITEHEWTIMATIIALSEPFCRAIQALSGDTYPTISLVYSIVRMICQSVMNMTFTPGLGYDSLMAFRVC